MLSDKLRLSLICVLIYIVVAGFVTQLGLLSGPIAAAYDIEVTSATATFSMLTGGFLLGTFLAYFLLDYFRMKSVVLGYSLIVILCTLIILFIENYFILPIVLGLIGIAIGISTCVAGLIIGKIWEGKKRESFFIGLDAAYNLGGILFPFITTYILSHHLPWGLCLLMVVTIIIAIIYLAFTSRFKFDNHSQELDNSENEIEWNSGIMIAGITLFLVIHGKYSIILWLPQFAQSSLSLGAEESGVIISTLFSTALIGCIAGMYVVTKTRVVYFICAAILTGFLSGLLFTYASSFSSILIIAAIFGLAVSALYNVFVVYGLNFVSQPSHKHISFIIFSSGIAATIAPYASSIFVEWFGNPIAGLYVGAASYGLALLVLIIYELYRLNLFTVIANK